MFDFVVADSSSSFLPLRGALGPIDEVGQCCDGDETGELLAGVELLELFGFDLVQLRLVVAHLAKEQVHDVQPAVRLEPSRSAAEISAVAEVRARLGARRQ